ncbi:MAG: hypothetical protein AUG09_02455 [Acidobacteria bacterium 13_1_20CM_2_68_7]|nr:MAG: hypothetical protein AUG09_02455 [Acidobacteria bacterium 13_1_20CM_2_68_7]
MRVVFLAFACCLATQAAHTPAIESDAARAPVVVGTAHGRPGEKVRGALKVAEDADGTPIVLPIEIVSGSRPGPVVWAQACSHGDEYGGPRALQDVVRGLDPKEMSGTLVAVMIANPPAFEGL